MVQGIEHLARHFVRVIKTEQLNGPKRAAIGKWPFYLLGPDSNPNGTFDPANPGPRSGKRTNENGRKHKITWANREVGDYRLCEKFIGGWKSNLGGSSAIILPNGDRCVDFSLAPGQVRTFRVNNVCPAARRS